MSSKGQVLRLVRSCVQWVPKDQIDDVPKGLRGIYALHRHRPRIKKYDVVYVGMAEGAAGVREHQSVRITEKHYSPWVRSRQEQLEADLQRAWERDPIVLMETKGTQEVRGKSEVVN